MLKTLRIVIAFSIALSVVALPAIGQAAEFVKPGEGCFKVESFTEDAFYTLDGVTVTLTGFAYKDGEADEFVGFDWTAAGGIVTHIWVKASQDQWNLSFNSDAGSVDLDSGADGRLHAISHVAICVADGGGDTDPGDGGDTDPGDFPDDGGLGDF